MEFPVIEWIHESFHVDLHVDFYFKLHVEIYMYGIFSPGNLIIKLLNSQNWFLIPIENQKLSNKSACDD